MSYHDENISVSDDILIYEETVNPSAETQDSEVSLYRWSPPCVLLLLETYKTMEVEFTNGKSSHKKVWDKVSTQLREKGYDVSAQQCAYKLRNLKKTYKSVKDHNNKSGNDRRTWQFFNVMEEMFAQKAWCDPVGVASSTGLAVTQSGGRDIMGESDRGGLIKPSTPKISTLLGKRLHQKEAHEAQKMERHRQRMELENHRMEMEKHRMEMDEKLLKVLEKLANK